MSAENASDLTPDLYSLRPQTKLRTADQAYDYLRGLLVNAQRGHIGRASQENQRSFAICTMGYYENGREEPEAADQIPPKTRDKEVLVLVGDYTTYIEDLLRINSETASYMLRDLFQVTCEGLVRVSSRGPLRLSTDLNLAIPVELRREEDPNYNKMPSFHINNPSERKRRAVILATTISRALTFTDSYIPL